MDAAASHMSDRASFHGGSSPAGLFDGVRSLRTDELDRRIQAGWDEWSELIDALSSTGGMLPSRELVGRVLNFFDDVYWSAEDARVEALRRQYRAEALRRCRNPDRSWELDGR